MAHDHAGRLARAADETHRSDLDALVVTPSADLRYLIGYDAPPLERLTALVIRPGRDPVLAVPALERPRAEASPAGGLVALEAWEDGGDPYELVRGLLEQSGRVGAADQMWAAHLIALQRALPHTGFEAASGVLSRLRIRKDPEEIALLQRAARAADETFRRISLEGLKGRPEEDVARSLAGLLVASGHDTADFTIVASGPNGASPHHQGGARSIRSGDPVVLDFGGTVRGYFSDITRTVSVDEPGEEIREVHDVVRAAQQAAFEAVAPGVPAQEIDRTARRVITDAGYGDWFVHRTGHGIGLEVHEEPYLVEGNAEPLAPGMCFSIEPGIYVGGRFGVRIEDIVAVTEDGAARLNHAPRELSRVP